MKMIKISFLLFMCVPYSILHASDAFQASVNGKPINHDTVMYLVHEKQKLNGGNPLNPDGHTFSYQQDKQQVINDLIESEILAQAAIQFGVQSTQEFKVKQRMQSNTLLAQIYLTNYRAQLKIEEQTIQARYQAMPLKHQYLMSRIKVDNIEAGKAALNALNRGQLFSDVADKYSLEANKKPGGLLGNMTQGQLPEVLWNALQNLKESQYSHQLIKSRKYWYLLYLTKKEVLPKKSYDRMRGRLENDLRQESLLKHVETLRMQAKIVRPKIENSQNNSLEMSGDYHE